MSLRYRLCQRFIGHRWGRLRFDSLLHMWGRECRFCKAWEYPGEQPRVHGTTATNTHYTLLH